MNNPNDYKSITWERHAELLKQCREKRSIEVINKAIPVEVINFGLVWDIHNEEPKITLTVVLDSKYNEMLRLGNAKLLIGGE